MSKYARIIHLSDLHFGRSSHRFQPEMPASPGEASSQGYPTFADSLKDDLENIQKWDEKWIGNSDEEFPVIFTITGDITNTASRDEFQHTTQMIESLTSDNLLGRTISKEDVMIVPGNHDLVYDEENIEDRWQPYTVFFKDHTGKDVDPSEPNDFNRVVDRSDQGLIIAEINSAKYVKKGAPDQDRGQVDFPALDNLAKQLSQIEMEKLNSSIRIAILHHHPVVLPMLAEPGRGYDAIVNGTHFLSILREYGFHLILHGHKHIPFSFLYDPISAWENEKMNPLMIIGGGSASVSARGIPQTKSPTNTYNMITVTWDGNGQQARIRNITRGLCTYNKNNRPLLPSQWHWSTLNVEERLLGDSLPSNDSTYCLERFSNKHQEFERYRKKEYERLRQNMLVSKVIPSAIPGQAYEAKVWIIPHWRPKREIPQRVTWLLGRKFPVITVEESTHNFCLSFSYYGPVLAQAQLTFPDGSVEIAYIYVNMPGRE